MKFRLTGKISYDVGSCHDSREVIIKKRFTAPTRKDGIKKARNTIKGLHERYSWHTDYGLQAKLSIVNTGPVWKVIFREAQDARPAEPAIPAKPARPAIAAHFIETNLK